MWRKKGQPKEGKTNVIEDRTSETFCDLKEEIWGNVEKQFRNLPN